MQSKVKSFHNLKDMYIYKISIFRKRMNNHKSDIRGTPTAETLGVDKHIHYCQLQKYNTSGTHFSVSYHF